MEIIMIIVRKQVGKKIQKNNVILWLMTQQSIDGGRRYIAAECLKNIKDALTGKGVFVIK